MACASPQLVYFVPPSNGMLRSVSENMWNRLLTLAIIFKPSDFDLPASFRLTELHNYGRQYDWRTLYKNDCSVMHSGIRRYQVTCVTQIVVMIDDPFIYGQIAAVSMMNKLHAFGILTVDNVLPLVEVGQGLSDTDTLKVAVMLLTGFNSAIRHLTGKTFEGRPCIIRKAFSSVGGSIVAMSCRSRMVPSSNAQPGDLLVLTKPLGASFVLSLYQSMVSRDANWWRVQPLVTEREVHQLYQTALDLMRLSERTTANLMQKYGAQAAAHVGKRGLVGQASMLAYCQDRPVNFLLTKVPIIARLAELAVALGDPSKLTEGMSSEVSGGLLICLPSSTAFVFVSELNQREGMRASVIGNVVRGSRTISCSRNMKVKPIRVGPF